MNTIEEDLQDIVQHALAWGEEGGLDRTSEIIAVVSEIRRKLKDVAVQSDALLRALEHLVSEERT